LRETLSLLNAGRPLQETLRFIVAQAVEILGADAGVIFRFDSAKDSPIVIEASAGFPDELRQLTSLPFIESSANRASLRGEVFTVPDLAQAMSQEAHLLAGLGASRARLAGNARRALRRLSVGAVSHGRHVVWGHYALLCYAEAIQ
jgi:GAF domain-containing protein